MRRRSFKNKRRQQRKRPKKQEVARQHQEQLKKQQEQEEASRKAAEQAAKEEQGSEEAEIQSLESVKADPSDGPVRENYDLFPQDVYSAYDKIQSFARDLNTQIPVPEIVVVGPRSSGKSSIIEAILGRPFNVVGLGGATKRPLFIQLINNPEAAEPRATLKRDPQMKEFSTDREVPLAELPEAVAGRNTKVSEDPVFLTIEHKNCLNMTIIDTPGLILSASTNESQMIENVVLNLIRPIHRLILAVEPSKEWTQMEMLSFVKRTDQELSRTTFVYTKFHSQLQDFSSTRAVNRFLSGTLPDVKTFFSTLPSSRVRARFRESDKYQEKLWQAYRRDMVLLEQLQYDKRYARTLGIHALRKYLLNLVWRSYQECIPRVLKHLRARRTITEQSLKEVESQLQSLDSSKLRAIASGYAVGFLQVIEQLLEGTSEGNPTVNGQTLEEEKSQQGDADWVDLYNRAIRFDPEDWGIPYWNCKVYGGQQFERLLHEFKAVSDHTEISEVTVDDVATAAGINRLNNIPNYAWAASDLAAQKSQDALVPLIEQLCERAVYIVKRLTDIVEKVMDGRRKKWLPASSPATSMQSAPSQSNANGVSNSSQGGRIDINNIEQYPYFTHHVKDLFYKFVDQTGKICKEKCMDEFLSTRTIYWDLTEHPDSHGSLPIERSDHEDTHAAVRSLSTELFVNLRKRITMNVLLKFYNFFLGPLRTDLWNEIQGKITCLGDEALEQVFEVSATKDKLHEDEKHLQGVIKKLTEQDQLFLDAATQFSHPVVLSGGNVANDA
eukprot:TRINITY_DN1984_c0_g3_i2.p1 TRINITY_DN1984_c0_g3~~TRINITY_DN1984_c0_g3_i2.p1  ORF type:complete len:781 (-),score=209.36 TRINITY_DN1984_c0_g3_i2:158-2500(-)